MNFITKPGRKNKNPKDKILFHKCPCCGRQEALKLIDWIRWARFKGNIEDLHYPVDKGFMGRNKLREFLDWGLRKGIGGNYLYSIEEMATMFKIEE